MIERFFGKLTDKAVRRGVFYGVPDRITAIQASLDATNADPIQFNGPPPPGRSWKRPAADA
jgi:hypothetical protein